MNDEIAEMREELAIVSKAFYEQNDYIKSKEIKKLRIAVIILSILLFFSVCGHIGWLIYENGMETVTETTEEITIEGVEQNANDDGNNVVVGGDYTNGFAKD